MSDIIKIAFIFVVIIVLLNKKWNVGYVLIAASLALAVLYLMHPLAVLKTVYSAVTSPVTFQLLIALTFIRMFEIILREKNVLQQMMESIKGVLKNKRGVIVSMPLLIGMLPSVGGAYFSAPMVEEATKGLDLSPEDKAFTNYWYRHPWELILPLYPGIILASVVTKVEMRGFILLNFCCAVTMLITGLIFGMKGVRGIFQFKGSLSQKALWSFTPILALLALVIVFGIRLEIALVCVVIMLLIYFRYDYASIRKVVKHGFSIEIVTLILGVMLFKESLQSSGAIDNLTQFFILKKIPLLPVLFLLPFISGILTGITVGFVGSTFPLLVSLTGADSHALAFAFVTGYAGVLLSPVHVCLILTREYFDAQGWGIYKRIIPAVLLVLSVSLIEYVMLSH